MQSNRAVRTPLFISLIVAQALLPVLGHSHNEPHDADQTRHSGFHVHFDGSHHHFHAHDPEDEPEKPGYSGRNEASVVVFLNFAAWELIKPSDAAVDLELADIPSLGSLAEPWFEWPPAPIAKPPTSEPLALQTSIYLSLCSFRC
jgi:hypothetical protein